MSQPDLSIGDVAKAAETSPESIRHYEKIGLIPPPPRTEAGRRVYSQDHLERLRFIRHSRALGFGLDAIRSLLDLSDHPERDCAEADRIASEHLKDVEQRIERLESLRVELDRMVGECRHNRSADCHVIKILSDHELCLTHDHTSP